jgi:cation:H+ antiporter
VVSAGLAVVGFLGGAAASLLVSFVLVSRLERVGERLGLSEALLGMVAALAADAPEITAAVTAVAHHEQRVGAGVVIGSNVFNLAALLGLGAVVAGQIPLHRKVVVLGGVVAMLAAGICLVVAVGVLPALAGLVLGLAVVVLYLLVLGHEWMAGVLPEKWADWLRSAVSEEELELEEAIRPRRGSWPDAMVTGVALVLVVVASVAMERSASALGSRYAVPEIVVGGLVLAAVTSLPNAVSAVYLAARGRGAAMLSTALNSNTLNVVAGLLLPAAFIGLGRPSGETVLITAWYVGLTAALLTVAYLRRGLSRGVGLLVIAAYVVFSASVIFSSYGTPATASLAVAIIAAGLVVAVITFAIIRRFARRASSASSIQQESLLPGWSARRLWLVGLHASLAVALVDGALGQHVVLIGLLIVGPCCALLSGRWVLTALAGVWALGLGVVLGIPDGIWLTSTHLVFLGAVAVVVVVSTGAAAIARRAWP